MILHDGGRSPSNGKKNIVSQMLQSGSLLRGRKRYTMGLSSDGQGAKFGNSKYCVPSISSASGSFDTSTPNRVP